MTFFFVSRVDFLKLNTQYGAIKFFILTGASEIVESFFGDADDMFSDKGGAFAGSVLGVFETTLPFEHSPAFEVILGELTENGFEIDLPVAQGAEASGAVHPALVAAIYALPAGGIKFGVLDMEHADAFVVDIDIFQVVETLQDEMGGVVQEAGPGMVIGVLQEGLIGDTVVQVFSRVDLIAEVDAMPVEFVEDGKPACRQLFKACFHQTRGPLGPGIESWPEQGSAKGSMGIEPKVIGGFGGIFQLLYCPLLAGGRVVVYCSGGKAVEKGVIGRVYGYQLSLQVGRQLGDLEAGILYDAFDLIRIGFTFGCFLEVDDPAVPTGKLNADITVSGGPFADGGEGIEGWLVAQELG